MIHASGIEMRKVEHVSSTQLGNFELCNRKWWLKSVIGLPTEQKQSFVIGRCLHGVIERYLKADEQGRGPDGSPVDLYPPGWDIAYEEVTDGATGIRHTTERITGRLDDDERTDIPRLIEAAITVGLLERQARRRIEFAVRAQIFDGVEMVSIIDLAVPPDVIEDHKSVKTWKYAKGKARLVKDPQLMIYCRFLLEEAKAGGGVIPDRFIIRHNQYCKDRTLPIEQRVRQVEAEITREEIEARWITEVVEPIRKMLKTSKILTLADVQGPTPGACFAYGGCEFQRICGHQETVQAYKARIELTNANRMARFASNQGGTTTMGFFDKLKKADSPGVATAPPASTAPAPTTNPPKPAGRLMGLLKKPADAPAPAPAAAAQEAPPAPQKTVVASAVPETTIPPWANPDCGACEGEGWNSKGNPCRICVSDSPSRKGILENCVVTGPRTWTAKIAPAKVAPEPKPAPKPALAPVKKTEITQEDIEATSNAAPPSEHNAEPEPEKGGRKRKFFTLLIGCVIQKTDTRRVIYLEDVFRDLRKKMCEAMGVENYWDIDAFRRRDKICFAADQYADDFGTNIVVATSSSASVDFKAFVDALRPYASTVIQSVIS